LQIEEKKMQPMKFRVKDETHCKTLQEALFEAGYNWYCDKYVVQHLDCEFLWAEQDGTLSQIKTNDEKFFLNTEEPEYTYTNGKFVPVCDEQPETKPFDLKTQPWYILVNSEKENKLALEWLFEQGMDWNWQKGQILWYGQHYLTNSDAHGNCCKYIMHGRGALPKAYEIKLTHKIVTDVQWPTIPVESEKDKAIRELQETIEKAKQQIDELMKH
jgi:hypothetical protein